MDEAERACSLGYPGHSFEPNAFGGELGSDLHPYLVMAEEAEKKTRGSEPRAGDQGGAHEATSLGPVFLHPGRPTPGDLGSYEYMVKAADTGPGDLGCLLLRPRYHGLGRLPEIITGPKLASRLSRTGRCARLPTGDRKRRTLIVVIASEAKPSQTEIATPFVMTFRRSPGHCLWGVKSDRIERYGKLELRQDD
jgi:hypothetical protein